MRPKTLLFFAALFLLAAEPALARRGFSSVACSLPEPALEHEAEPDSGFDLGDLYSRELGPVAEAPVSDEEGESEDDESEAPEESSSFGATFEPVVQLDWDSERQVTNLTPHPRGAGRRLHFGDYRSGFYVAASSRLGLGLGGQVSFSFGNTTFLGAPAWATVGLLPVAGRETYSYRWVQTRREAEARAIPPRLDDALASLPSLSDGDMLSYETEGGIVFWGGLGAGQLGLGLAALARGDFRVQLEKVGDDQVHVKVTESRVTSLALQGGAGLVSASASAYRRYARDFGFLIRFRERTGALAFHDLVRGNIAAVQKLALARGGAVKFHDASYLERAGRSRQVFVGFPVLLNFSYGRDRFVELHRTHSLSCGRRIEVVYGAWFRRRQFQAFRHREQDLRAFYGASYAIRGKKGRRAAARGFFGELVMKYAAERAAPFRLAHAMEKLAERTGLGPLLRLGVHAPSPADLLYSSVTLRARFGAGQTREIVRRAPSLPASSPALLRMREEAARLAQALRRGDEKSATEAYARFGEAMLSGPDTFRTGLALAGKGARVDYTVEGSDFSLYTDTFAVKDANGNLERVNRPPLVRRHRRP